MTTTALDEQPFNGIMLSIDAYYPIIDGVIRIVDELNKHYQQLGKEHFILCPNYPGKVEANHRIRRYPSIRLPYNYPFRMALPIWSKKPISNIPIPKIDIVHIHAPFFIGRYMYAWARKHNKPVVFTYHSKFNEKIYNTVPISWIANRVYKWVINFVNKCDVITTPTKSFQKILINDGIDTSKCIVVPHGIADIPIPSSKDRERIASDTILKNIQQKKNHKIPIFLYVGQLIREKNPEFLIQSLAVLKEKQFPFYAVIVGMGDQARNLKKLVKRLNLTNEVLFTGKIADKHIIHAIYDHADLFTFPSTYETQGMVVLEAAQHAVPTLGIEGATGISDFVVHQKTGFLAKKTPHIYADAIIKALTDQDTLQKVKQAAKDKIPVTVSEMIVTFEQIYKKVL